MLSVYLLDCSTIAIDKYLDILSPIRKKLLLNLGDSGKRASIGLELLLIEIVKRIDPSCSLPLDYGHHDNGKPYLLDYLNYHISLAHSGKYALVGISDMEIGVDIERAKPNYQSLGRRFLGDSSFKEEDFYKYWIKMESYYKIYGKMMELSELETLEGYEFWFNKLDDYYLGCLYRDKKTKINITTLTESELWCYNCNIKKGERL